MNKVKLIAIYKHNIVYKNIKHKNVKTFVMSLSIMIVLMLSMVLMKNSNMFSESILVANPINELYRDVQVATFVNSENMNFILPVKTEKINNLDTAISMEVIDNIMIIAPASGEIVEIGNGENKYIKIKHSETITSVISNIGICGVDEKKYVKQGKEIATANPGSEVKIEILENGKNIKGLYIYKSFIKWD